MLIRSKQQNSLVEFDGNGVFWQGGYVFCACGGASIPLMLTSDKQEIEELLDGIQKAYASGREIYVIK